MHTLNMDISAIDTDRDLISILGNFSDDYIESLIRDSFSYRFRPFGAKMPNYVYSLEQKFAGIYDNYVGTEKELIDQKRYYTYENIINIICEFYNLSLTDEVPMPQIYTLAYVLSQTLISEFSDKLIGFFTNYIIMHKDELINALPDELRSIKSAYSKKVYHDPKQIIIYENINTIIDMIAGIDISFDKLFESITDVQTAQFVSQYIVDKGDIFKNYFASFIMDPTTRTMLITSIKLGFVEMTNGINNI